MVCVSSIYIYGNVELCDHTMYLAMLMDESITNPESIEDIMTYKKKLSPILAMKNWVITCMVTFLGNHLNF